jgi:hypothetical protein
MIKQEARSVPTAWLETPMDDPLHHRDHLEQHVLAFGEPIAPEQLPDSLAWRVWQPVTQRLYDWAWAPHRAYLYCRLDDAYGRGGLWRLPFRCELRRHWHVVQRHLGPLEPVAAFGLLFARYGVDLALS